MTVPAQAHRILEQPSAIWVKRDACIGKTLGQGDDGLNFLFTAKHPAFEFEVLEAVTCLSCLGQPHDAFAVHGWLVAQAQPIVVRFLRVVVGQAGGTLIANIKKVAEYRNAVTLLALAQQCCHRDFQKLPEQV